MKKKWRKRSSAMVLVLAMVFSLFGSVPVYAEDEPEEAETSTGLVWTYVDCSDDGWFVPEKSEYYQTTLWEIPKMHDVFYFGSRDEQGNVAALTGELSLKKVTRTAETEELDSVTDTTDGTISSHKDSNSYSGFYEIYFNESAEGEYRIYSNDSFLTVYVSDPDAGYYSASDIDVANYIEDHQIRQMEETTVYFAYKTQPEEGRTLAIDKDSNGNVVLYQNSENGEGGDVLVSGNKVAIEQVSVSADSSLDIYKVTLKDSFDGWYLIVNLTQTIEDGENEPEVETIPYYLNVDHGEPFGGIYISEQGNLFEWTDEEGKLHSAAEDAYYFVDDETDQIFDVTEEVNHNAATQYSFRYNKANHTLTLNNMQVSLAEGSNLISSDYDGLIIELIGENYLFAGKGTTVFLNGDTTVTQTGTGTLTAKTNAKRQKWIEETNQVIEVADEADDPDAYYPSAIEAGEGCGRFVNYATITGVAENATKHEGSDIAFYNLSCYGTKNVGTLVNFGTINGRIETADVSFENLVTCRTEYSAPTDHPYIGKAYYFTSEPIYPNNMIDKLPEGTWRVVGEYNEKGEPIPSQVWYQYIYVDATGAVLTEDWDNPMQFLVYGDNPEKLLTPSDVVAVTDGGEHTFNTDLYAVWMTDGNVTVNGNVTVDVACFCEPEQEDVKKEEIKGWLASGDYPDTNNPLDRIDGEYGLCYMKDAEGNVIFPDTSDASVTVTGNTGCLSLNQSYKGNATIQGDVNYCALYKDADFLKKWLGRWQWQYENSTYQPGEVYYCAIPKAGEVIKDGQFSDTVKVLAGLVGASVYDGTYFAHTENEITDGEGTEKVAGTTAVINDSTMQLQVSKKSGLENDTYPLVRKASDAAESNIKSHLSDSSNMVLMDISMIQQEKDTKGDVVKQEEVEPSGKVNLYFDIALSGLKNPALFHIKDDGTVEKLSTTKSGDLVTCETSSFSTYVFAEDQDIINPPSSGGGSTGGGTTTGGSTSGSNTTIETRPNGTKVETSTETKADGTKVDTTVETKTDGTRTETVVETAKDGSVKTTETVTQADGSATKKSVIAKSSATTSTTVTVKKDAKGTITSASASIINTVSSGNKATVSASVVSQIMESAGTESVSITMTVKDSEGNTKYKVKVNTEDLQAGEELFIYKLNTKTGEYVMVSAKTYKVSNSGNVAVSMSKKATYELVTAEKAAKIDKQIKSTIKPKKASAAIKQGKTIHFTLSSKANKENIKSITYTTSKKSVATVSKNGKISAKGKGSVTIKAKITFKDGSTKTIKMTIKVQ
ncbi:MAG: Ig-like domain-containing protein [Agathobacter sp.]